MTTYLRCMCGEREMKTPVASCSGVCVGMVVRFYIYALPSDCNQRERADRCDRYTTHRQVVMSGAGGMNRLAAFFKD